MKKGLIRLCAVILVLLAVCAFLGCEQDPEQERIKAYYDLGVEAYNNKDFYTAREYFREAESYGNSKDYLEAIEEYERIYLEGVSKLESRDYDGARACFEAVKDFSNSAQQLEYIDGLKLFYQDALRCYSEEDYVLARERFSQSMGYSRADEYIASIDAMEEIYQKALLLYHEQNYRAAIAELESIGVNYRDTYDLISTIYGELEHAGVKITDYLAAYLKSHQDEPVEFLVTDINEIGFMVTDTAGLLFTGNTDEYGIIQSVSFWVDEKIVAQHGRDYVDRLLAHCIHALAIDLMGYQDVLDNMEEYTEGRATCGNFAFDLDYEDNGYAVLNANYIYADD